MLIWTEGLEICKNMKGKDTETDQGRKKGKRRKEDEQWDVGRILTWMEYVNAC